MLNVKDIAEIRAMVNRKGMSVRKTSKVLKWSRPTILKYLKDPKPGYRMKAPRAHPLRDQIASRIDAILAEWSSRKNFAQRITGTHVHKQLLKEGYQVGITLVRECLRDAITQKKTR